MRRNMRMALFALATIGLSASAATQNVRYLSTDEALSLEHQTRYARIRRLAQSFGVYPEPELRDYIVPASVMPADFRHDVAVLRIVFPENTFFDTASAEVKPSAIPIIRAMAAMLDGDVPDVTTFVAGHADSRGGEDYNHNLSIRRSRAVAALLSDYRQRSGPVWSIGFGKSVPLYPNSSDANMSYNRRVEFLLAARIEAVATWLKDQAGDVCRTRDDVERVRCMTSFRQERKEFVAEKVDRIAVTPTKATRDHVDISDGKKIRVKPQQSDQIRIQLNERRIYVREIEH